MAKKAKGDRKEEIIADAIELVDESGLLSLTARNVADRLGIPSSSVFYHFPTHLDLFSAVQSTIMEQAEKIVAQFIAEPGRSNRPGSMLEGYIKGTLRWAQLNPVHVKILASPFILAKGEAEIREQHLLTTSRGIDKIYGFLAIGIAEKHFATQRALRPTAELIHCCLSGACQRMVYNPIKNRDAVQEFFDEFWGMVLGHIQSE